MLLHANSFVLLSSEPIPRLLRLGREILRVSEPNLVAVQGTVRRAGVISSTSPAPLAAAWPVATDPGIVDRVRLKQAALHRFGGTLSPLEWPFFIMLSLVSLLVLLLRSLLLGTSLTTEGRNSPGAARAKAAQLRPESCSLQQSSTVQVFTSLFSLPLSRP